ncbi:TPA: helicase C-terminal domain-containing protein [Aeromonas veronii]
MRDAITSSFLVMGLTPRDIQLDYAVAVSEAIADEGHISLLHAETGVGKSLGYLVAGAELLAKQPSHRLIIATHSHALLNQLAEKDAPRVCDMIAKQHQRYLRVSKLFGRSNYVDPSRIEQAMLGKALTEDENELLSVLLDWEHPIDKFVEEYGELPFELTNGQICMLPTSKNDDFEARREEAMNSDIILTTHAMLAVDMMLGGTVLHRDKKTHLIIDEADMLAGLLKDMQVRRLNLLRIANEVADLASTRQLNRLYQLMDSIRAEATNKSMVWSERADELAEETLLHLGIICADADTIPDALKGIFYLRGNGELGLGVSTVRGEPAIICVDSWASKRFAGYIEKHSAGCIMTSGTLSITEDPVKGMHWIRSELGIDKQGNLGLMTMFSPSQFGTLTLTLAGSDFPPVFINDDENEVRLNPLWVKETAIYISKLHGKVVVLTNSHKESVQLSDALQGLGEARPIHRHVFGSKLAISLSAFMTQGGILITPAGHVGLDIRTDDNNLGFDKLVITRIGYAPPKTETLKALAEFKKVRAKSRKDVLPLLLRQAYMGSLGDAIRKGRQAIGRGIRAEHDEIHVSILDPRFPLFDDLSSKHSALRNIIPYRFHSAYRDASLVLSNQNNDLATEIIF